MACFFLLSRGNCYKGARLPYQKISPRPSQLLRLNRTSLEAAANPVSQAIRWLSRSSACKPRGDLTSSGSAAADDDHSFWARGNLRAVRPATFLKSPPCLVGTNHRRNAP